MGSSGVWGHRGGELHGVWPRSHVYKDQMTPNPFSNQTPHLGLSNLRAVGSIQALSLTTS